MMSKISFFALALTLGTAASAAAQVHANIVYQNALLARSLSAEDKAICERKASAGDAAAQDACRVTRLFIADINAGKVGEKIYPPLAHIKYAVSKVEREKISDHL
ncbi:MAG: hypothetical protein NUW21_07705 [Elusimicrobia bacterium]|nr:hypothetical protein [Elusimicrobiota bacterium]